MSEGVAWTPLVESSSRPGLGNPLRAPSTGVQGRGHRQLSVDGAGTGSAPWGLCPSASPDSGENREGTQLFAVSPWSPEAPGSLFQDDRGLLAPGWASGLQGTFGSPPLSRKSSGH